MSADVLDTGGDTRVGGQRQFYLLQCLKIAPPAMISSPLHPLLQPSSAAPPRHPSFLPSMSSCKSSTSGPQDPPQDDDQSWQHRARLSQRSWTRRSSLDSTHMLSLDPPPGPLCHKTTNLNPLDPTPSKLLDPETFAAHPSSPNPLHPKTQRETKYEREIGSEAS